MKTWFCAVSVALLAAGAAAATSPIPASTNSTIITSDRLDVDYQHSIAVFEGNVVVRDPKMRIESEKLTVWFSRDNNIRSVTAQGNVHILQGDKLALCRKAVYVAATGEIVLTGNASVQRGKDLVVGDVITFWVGEDRMVSEPGYLQITPQPKGNKPAAGGTLPAQR